ncbi:MAG: hypothetical protein P9M11_00275 [Candidatus Tenebribacter burtonii]|jgi:hypothetical protein|nr:hypothetical protein [Candidatus Tenebribacter burtonii]
MSGQYLNYYHQYAQSVLKDRDKVIQILHYYPLASDTELLFLVITEVVHLLFQFVYNISFLILLAMKISED